MANQIPRVDVDARAQRLVSPRDTKGWKTRREGRIELFVLPDGGEFVRAHPREVADVIITFERLGGQPLRLVGYERSSAQRRLRRAERKVVRRTRAKQAK